MYCGSKSMEAPDILRRRVKSVLIETMSSGELDIKSSRYRARSKAINIRVMPCTLSSLNSITSSSWPAVLSDMMQKKPEVAVNSQDATPQLVPALRLASVCCWHYRLPATERPF